MSLNSQMNAAARGSCRRFRRWGYLPLAVAVLAALALTLAPPPLGDGPERAEAQQYCGRTIWRGTLTVGASGVTRGYDATPSTVANRYGSLTPVTFNHGGEVITVRKVQYYRSGANEGVQIQFMWSGTPAFDALYAIYFDGVKAAETPNEPAVTSILGPGQTETQVALSGSDVVVPTWSSGDTVIVELRSLFICPPPPPVPTTTLLPAVMFEDVAPDAPYHGDVQYIARRGITAGCGTEPLRFCPDQPVTRAQMALLLSRALDLPDPPSDERTFADVGSSHFASDAVEAVHTAGIAAHCATDPLRFCPADQTTLAQMATFLRRAFAFAAAIPQGFDDTRGSAHEADIDALYRAGIMDACGADPLRFCPDDPVTRAQMATFLSRALRHR